MYALTSLRTIVRSLGHACESLYRAGVGAFDETGEMNDERMTERTIGLGGQVTRFAALHEAGQQPEFLHEWEIAPENPGAEKPSQVHS